MSRRLTPLYVFNDAAEYQHRHTQGTLIEFQNESRAVNIFNAKQTPFKAWVVAKIGQGKERSSWVFLVRPGDSAEYCFPKEGESCEVMLLSKTGKEKKSKWWDAERVDNPAASMGLPEEAHHLAAFEVKVPNNVPVDLLRPLKGDPEDTSDGFGQQKNQKYLLGDKKAVRVNFKLSISAATKDAEVGAVTKLFSDPKENRTDKQHAAFQYLLNFKNPRFTVNIFNHFPHLRDPMNNPGGMPQKVIRMLEGFDEHQIVAYRDVLSNLPCGICIIPGGPGAGKTHWNLVLTAAIQSKDVFWYGPEDKRTSSAKVLYILDINKPLDDTSNKIVKLYKSLGLKKFAVRLYGWHYNGSGTGSVDFTRKFLFTARLSRYRRQTFKQTCLAPTLDELAWEFYDANKTTRYTKLYSLLAKALNNGGEAKSEDFKSCVNQLYRDVLARVDFIATTPVPAATAFDGLFKPDIVVFDESPHAREASTLVAIAHFEPIAWVFSGDHRQTRPFVASDDVRDNPLAPQMLVSMMERADRAGAIRHSLLINHRAYGGLQRLASDMFYDGKMISGYSDNELFPPSVQHLQRFLERFMNPDDRCHEPRLVAFSPNRGEVRVGTSWYNADHMDWVMDRVGELLSDTMFRQVGKTDRGTILIIAPYKEAYMKYKKAIQNLPKAWAARLGVGRRLEARTIDTVQGGEADFVFLDLVRSEATNFTDDPNRLCVALTRARQAEVVLMHPGNEQRALEQDAARRAQIERERSEFGLEPRIADSEVPKVGISSLEDKKEPESIFASQFADIAALLEDVLAENKRQTTSQRNTSQGQDIQYRSAQLCNGDRRGLGAISESGDIAPTCNIGKVGTPAHGMEDAKEGISNGALSGAQYNGNPSETVSESAGRNLDLAVSRRSTTGEGLAPIGDIMDTTPHAQNLYSTQAMAPPRGVASDQEHPKPVQPRPTVNAMQGGVRGTEGKKKTDSLPAGQSWW
ncbi:hypothetical protein SLS53_005273 [Cytospora paraplurivora]|uniref:DNA2/NAM7 helicase-like C-terminal domain-containing protein n=1 Tax=Cytospora paraplurivora TaxID=2898453 RepID=A0AAN9U909_9PEZI